MTVHLFQESKQMTPLETSYDEQKKKKIKFEQSGQMSFAYLEGF